MSDPHVDVLIVGGGPTGLAIANALGQGGVGVLLVEQDSGVAELPRAVSVDDEAMRFMQSLGLLDAARRVVLPGTGTKYFGARGQLLAYARGPERPPYGHPIKNPMDHSDFQRVLLEGARRLPSVEIRHQTTLLGFNQDESGVTARVETRRDAEEVRCRYLVGADGGRSLVRTAIGQEPMEGLAFEERWLVLDTLNDPHDERFAMHYGDPGRPRVVIVGRDGRCRYEFLVEDDEPPDEADLFAFARDLIAPYRTLERSDVVRCTIYKFYALVARRFGVGRVFLAGDAAHMMPPFAGQGLNSGLRDAANLGWKLVAVVRGQGSPRLLDTYTLERRPHVAAMVQLSVRMGAVMMTRSRAKAWARDLVLMGGQRVPFCRRYLREMRFKPPARYEDGFLAGAPSAPDPVGSMLVQPRVLIPDGELVQLDGLLGSGFALLGVDVAPNAFDRLAATLWDRLGATRVHVTFDDRLPARGASCAAVADADGLLAEQLAPVRGRFLLVRPDRFVAGIFGPEQEHAFAAEVESLLGLPALASRAAVTA